MVAGPLQHSSSKAPNHGGKMAFYSHFAECARHKGSSQWGRGRSRIRPQAWVRALHPPAVASAFFAHLHGPALLLDVFTPLMD